MVRSSPSGRHWLWGAWLLVPTLIVGALVFLGSGRWAELPAHGGALSVHVRGDVDSMHLSFQVPKTVRELVKSAHVIVVGRVGPVVREGRFLGYGERGRLKVAPPSRNHPDLNWPYVDQRIEVDRVLSDDGRVASGKPLILRMPGFTTATDAETARWDAASEYPLSRWGDRRLFFLTQNPDGETYGLRFGSLSRLVIDGRVVTSSDGDRSPLRLDGELASPTAFVQRITSVLRTGHDQTVDRAGP